MSPIALSGTLALNVTVDPFGYFATYHGIESISNNPGVVAWNCRRSRIPKSNQVFGERYTWLIVC